jgi:ABC-type multidrug transport system ATPase subunit
MGVTAGGLVARRGRFVLDVPVFRADASGTAVLGPNGAGKTTLLYALQGLIARDGSVEKPARTAAVFARPAVLRGSALWNVAAVVSAALHLPLADARTRARSALGDVGLTERSGADARTLSTGERQRLAIARALAVEPQAMFLDEPFANVDADARPYLRALLRSYADRTRCDLVLVTASLADAAALCATAVVLRQGCIVHEGSLADVGSARDEYVQALVAESQLVL